MSKKENFAQIGVIDLIGYDKKNGFVLQDEIEQMNSDVTVSYASKYKEFDELRIFIRFDGYSVPKIELNIPEDLKDRFKPEKNPRPFFRSIRKGVNLNVVKL